MRLSIEADWHIKTNATPLDGEQHIRGMVGEDYETRRCDFSKENDIKHGKTHPF